MKLLMSTALRFQVDEILRRLGGFGFWESAKTPSDDYISSGEQTPYGFLGRHGIRAVR